jgi:hypothetical protein
MRSTGDTRRATGVGPPSCLAVRGNLRPLHVYTRHGTPPEKLPLECFGVALATRSRPRDILVFKEVTRATIRTAMEETLRPEYAAGKFEALEYGMHPRDAPESWTGVEVNDMHRWFVSVHPDRQTTGVYAIGRPGSGMPPFDSGPEGFFHWVWVARNVAVATELALGTPVGSPCYIAVSKKRSVRRLPKKDAYVTLVDDTRLRYAEPVWTAWLQSELERVLPEFE